MFVSIEINNIQTSVGLLLSQLSRTRAHVLQRGLIPVSPCLEGLAGASRHYSSSKEDGSEEE